MRTGAALCCLLLLSVGVAGCEDLGGGMYVVNETESPLVVFQHTIAGDGARYLYTTTSCSSSDLEARTEDGTVIAELTEEWCPGQTWTITGPGESKLEGEPR